MGLFSFFNNQRSIASLNNMDSHRLSDLGLNKFDLYDARHLSSKKAGCLLNARRSERAHFWLR